MSRFYGVVGYVQSVETAPGVYADEPVERVYYGDVIKSINKWQPGSSKLNDDLNIENRISILAEKFAYSNIYAMRYVVWAGTKWKINSVEDQRPRLILSLGGVYNGPENGTPSEADRDPWQP